MKALVKGESIRVTLLFKKHFSTEDGNYFKVKFVRVGCHRMMPPVDIENMNNVFQLGTAFDYEKLVLVMLSYILTR